FWLLCRRVSRRRIQSGSIARASQMFSKAKGQLTSCDANHSAVSRKSCWLRTPREPAHWQKDRIASSSTAAMSLSSGVLPDGRCRSSVNCTGRRCSEASSLGSPDSSIRQLRLELLMRLSLLSSGGAGALVGDGSCRHGDELTNGRRRFTARHDQRGFDVAHLARERSVHATRNSHSHRRGGN